MTQQPARTAPGPGVTDWRTRALPTTLRCAQGAVGVVAAVHVVALVLVLTHWHAFHVSVATHHPGFTAAMVDQQTQQVVLQSLVPHIVLPIVLLWRAWALRGGGRRAQVVLTVLLGIELLVHATLPLVIHRVPGFGTQIIAVQAFSFVFEVSALVLLWRPAARRWFRTMRREVPA